MQQGMERVPPQAVDVERTILATVILLQEGFDEVVELLVEDDFYKPVHRQMYHCMLNLYSRGDAIDQITITDEMEKQGFDEQPDYAFQLSEDAGISSNMERYCEIVRQKSVRRQLIVECNNVIAASYDMSNETDEVTDMAQRAVFAVTDRTSGNFMSSLGETMVRVMQQVSHIQESGVALGLRTGLDIDQTLSGFQDAKLYVLGARPSMGKTALVMTFLRTFARNEIGCGILSLETSDEALGIRLIAQSANLEAQRITSGQMSGEEMERFSDAVATLSGYKIWIDDEPAISAQKMRSKCRLMAKKGARIIFIDFLQLMQAEGRTKHEEIGNLTKTAKAVSKELGVPIVLLSQLSRKVEDRTDKRPQMADLRESGSIEEDADAILFLYRPEYYGITTTTDGKSTKGLAEIIVAKNKDGATGTKRQRFIEEYMRFENIAYDESPAALPPPTNSFYDTDIDDEEPF